MRLDNLKSMCIGNIRKITCKLFISWIIKLFFAYIYYFAHNIRRKKHTVVEKDNTFVKKDYTNVHGQINNQYNNKKNINVYP